MVLSVPNAYSPDAAFDARWASWKAVAAVQDQLWHRRATMVAAVGAVVGTAVLALSIYWR